MQIYLVGGAVRDALLGLPVADRDWVVVGATAEQMVADGFLPVGKDFPVFLHPLTHEEYALARTERKTAPGYRGFVVHAAPDVTLEQDLARRDITINSIAVYAALTGTYGIFTSDNRSEGQHQPPQDRFLPPEWQTGLVRVLGNQSALNDRGDIALVDPFNGVRDLTAKVLRHVSPAFAEDPVRILRVARFAARFPDFSVAPETLQLMRGMVDNGEADALAPERVWQELSKGLMAGQPSRMMQVLQRCGALPHLLPLRADPADRDFAVLDHAAALNAPLAVRFACLMQICQTDNGFLRRIPHDCRDLAGLLARELDDIKHCQTFGAPALVALLMRCDALRRPARFKELLLAFEIGVPPAAALARKARTDAFEGDAIVSNPRALLLAALAALQSVRFNALPPDYSAMHSISNNDHATGTNAQNAGDRMLGARVQAVARLLSPNSNIDLTPSPAPARHSPPPGRPALH